MTHAAGVHADGTDRTKLQVEATIRRAVSDVIALPCHVLRTVAGRVGEPVAMVRSLSGLTLGGLARRWAPFPEAPEPAASTRPQRTTGRAADPPVPTVRARGQATGAPTAPARPSATSLPLDDYESLAASQVVARLERLDRDELRRIQVFETSHRGRRTVLGKIEQLLAVASS